MSALRCVCLKFFPIVALAALLVVPAAAQAQRNGPVLVPQGRPFLGVSVVSVDCEVVVTGIVLGSPAWRAGLESGDTILSVDGARVCSSNGLACALRQAGACAQFRIRDCRTCRIVTRTIRIR
jgi:predicted metalloprotease with PDZ domain